MLQQIRFFLTNEYYTSLEPGLDEICAAAMNGIPEGAILQLSFTPIPEKEFTLSFDALSTLSPAEPVPADKKICGREHFLAVTDSSVVLHRLLAEGYYAIALYHETNHSYLPHFH